MRAKQKYPGFTIPELLIVVIVIAVLVTTTVTAYRGAQNRTYDAAIQSDIQKLSNQFNIFTPKMDTTRSVV